MDPHEEPDTAAGRHPDTQATNRTAPPQSRTQTSSHPRHTNHERAFARYRDSSQSQSSEDELDSVPLSVHRDRIAQSSHAHSTPQSSEPLDASPPPQQRRLIDQVTNQWRNRPGYSDYADYTDDEGDEFFTSSDYQQDLEYWKNKGSAWIHRKGQTLPKPIRRTLTVTLIIAVACWAVFTFWVNPWLREHAFWDKIFTDATIASKNDGMATYGSQMELNFDHMVQVKTLDREHLPHGKRPGRLIFIGDVHGCKAELVHLLEKADFNRHKDHVILTGDIINKGPDTPGVVDLVRSIGASCVRGNHEDKILLLREELSRKDTLLDPSPEQLAHEAAHLPASEARARKTARQLSHKQTAWLQSCPVILRVGSLPSVGPLVAVHAGLAPGVPLAKQDPFQVMNMRSIDPETRVPSEDRDGEKWDKVWAEWQERAHKADRTTVVYGHDSKRGLNVHGRWAKGLDSGCVNGEKLTALTVDAEGRQEIVQVKCSSHNRD